ncbi:MAG: 2-hydroxychromene-2-carboxylate isomerase [Parvularculaceae bacterium]
MVTPMTTVDFIFDFGSPNSYLAHKVLPAISARTGATFQYVPVLLGGIFKLTGNQSPMTAFANIKNKMDYEMLEMRRFIEKHRISFVMNPHFPVNTLLIMRGAVAAEGLGAFDRYVDVVMDAMWARPEKMDDLEIVRGVLASSGLDANAILQKTQEPTVKARLAENTELAVKRGAFGAPTFFIGEDMWFGKDRLTEVEEALGRDVRRGC